MNCNRRQFLTPSSVVRPFAEMWLLLLRLLIEREIQEYIRKYPVLRYAGAFESDAVLFFADRISGGYNFVTALPVSRLIVFLREQGVDI